MQIKVNQYRSVDILFTCFLKRPFRCLAWVPNDLFDSSKEAPERKDTVLARSRPTDGCALSWAGVVAIRPLSLHVDALQCGKWFSAKPTNSFFVFSLSPKLYFHKSILCLNSMDWMCTWCIWSTDTNLKQWDYLMVSTCAAPYLSIVVDLSFVVKLDQYFCGGKLSWAQMNL